MHQGAVCRCIKSFTGISSDELTLDYRDLVQVHVVVDKIWLEGQSNDAYGRFPSNSVIEVELPQVPQDASLFIVANNFEANETGDLRLEKGNFVIGLRSIDESWWFGRSMGKEGMFPLNFVWPVNLSLLNERKNVEQEVSFYVKVKNSIRAQLPEELSLSAGDIVKVTHIVDSDWYRGELFNEIGIFPRAFVKVWNDATLGSVDRNSDHHKYNSLASVNQNPEDHQHDKPLTSINKNIDNHQVPTLRISDQPPSYVEEDLIKPYGIAMFSFRTSVENELPFSTGETIQLIQHVDSHWTLGRLGDKEGIFPTTFVNIMVDCPSSHVIDFDRHTNFEDSATTDIFDSLQCDMQELDSKQLAEEFVDAEIKESSLSNDRSDDQKEEVLIETSSLDDVVSNKYTSMLSPESSKFEAISSGHYLLSNDRPDEQKEVAIETSSLDEVVSDKYTSMLSAEFSKVEEISTSHSLCESDDVAASSEEQCTELPPTGEPCGTMRRHLLKELIETEHEYIHDLESFIQVVQISRRLKEAKSVDVDILLGNIDDVLEFSKIFLKKLHAVCFNDDENLMVGHVFVECSDKLLDVYKIYSSHHSLIVQPSLQKYQTGGDSLVYLEYILKELRQHKIKLMDMGSVLIKPVQRILKYPLFIDRLIANTPFDHKDFRQLEEAKLKMQGVAKDINDYTKRIDLVNKYKIGGSVHSLEDVIHKMSVHSVAKKGHRLKTRLSASIGLFSQFKDIQFEEEVTKFHSLVKAANGVLFHGEKLLDVLNMRHLAELNIVEAIAVSYVVSDSPLLESLRNSSRDHFNRIFANFKSLVERRVLKPIKMLIQLCEGPERVLTKRNDKLLDFNQSEQRLERNRDPTRTRILEEEHLHAKGIFEALHTQLLYDLPKLTCQGTQILTFAMKTLVGVRMQLQGQLAKSFLQLSTHSKFSWNDSSLEEQMKSRLTGEMSKLLELSFLPHGYTPNSTLPKRKSLVQESQELKSGQGTQQDILTKYPHHSLYVVNIPCVCDSQMSLEAKTGDIVAVLKEKDPSGTSDRWFVDNGKSQGFVRNVNLRKLSTTEIQNMLPAKKESTSNASFSTTYLPERKTSSEVKGPDESGLPTYEDLYKLDDQETENIYCEIPDEPNDPKIDQEAVGKDSSGDSNITRREIYENIDDDIENEENEFYFAMYNYNGTSSNQLNLYEGQAVLLLSSSSKDWWFVENRSGERGYVPSSYLAKYS